MDFTTIFADNADLIGEVAGAMLAIYILFVPHRVLGWGVRKVLSMVRG